MLPDKDKYREAGYIGEELFDDKEYELDRQCMSVQRAIERNLFPREVALKAYSVTAEQYENFLAKTINKQLQTYLWSEFNIADYSAYLHIMNRMLLLSAGENNVKYLAPLLKELKKLSKDIEKEKVTFQFH